MKTRTERIQELQAEIVAIKKESQAEKAEKARQRWERQAKERQDLKDELAETHGLNKDAKFEKAWIMAWDHGHSEGYDRVREVFEDLAELIKP